MTRGGEDRERIGVPARAVEGEHQLSDQALPQRVVAEQLLAKPQRLKVRRLGFGTFVLSGIPLGHVLMAQSQGLPALQVRGFRG